jgi:hypothetical protein
MADSCRTCSDGIVADLCGHSGTVVTYSTSPAEMANPQRMGAALTYARRYALFTLVGIAGEDDPG